MVGRRLWVLAATAIVLVACQLSTPPPSIPGGFSTVPASARPVPTAAPIDYDQLLYGSEYQPMPGVSGGNVSIAHYLAGGELNPYFSPDVSASWDIFPATMRTLLRVTSDGHWQPDLAAHPISYARDVTLDGSGEGFTVHVTLKPNLKWSDGQPMTLSDLEYTQSAVLDPAQAGIRRSGWENVDRIDVAANGLAADIHFPRPFAGWLQLIGGSTILPEHYMKSIPIKDWPSRSYPLSPEISQSPTIGPFKYVTASTDTIELARDDNWAGGDHPAYLDGITYMLFSGNRGGMIDAFRRGTVDVALGLQQADYDAVKDVDPAIGRVLLEPVWRYEHFDMNQAALGRGRGHPALRDIQVRKAIAQAIDRKALWETQFPGTEYPDNNPCAPSAPSNYWTLPGATCPSVDIVAANAALDAAGYPRGADGIRVDKDGNPLVFEHCTFLARQLGGEFIAKSLREIGIELNLNYVDFTILFGNWSDVRANTKCNLARGTYDTSEFFYGLTFDLFSNFFYSYHSTQIPTVANNGKGFNYLRMANADMDASIDVLTDAIDPKAQVEAVYRIQQIYLETIAEVVLYYPNKVVGVDVALENVQIAPNDQDLWNVEDWWLKK